MAERKKAIHTIVLDAGPLITNTPSISTLLQKAEQIFTTPAVVGEIKDATARARLETLVIPFLTLRTPSANSTKFVVDFARKSGDLPVLSKTDIEVIALAYELECERNGGDWRLRKVPGQKTVNGPPPVKEVSASSSGQQLPTEGSSQIASSSTVDPVASTDQNNASSETAERPTDSGYSTDLVRETEKLTINGDTTHEPIQNSLEEPFSEVAQEESISISNLQRAPEPVTTLKDPGSERANTSNAGADDKHSSAAAETSASAQAPPGPELSSDSEDDSDSEGWITPSNIAKHKISSQSGTAATASTEAKTLQVATVTTDYALQNTLLLMNLNLLSSSLTRIAHVKSHILRCHACFATTKQMEKQFCPRCGQAALTRVTTSTNADGTTALHLKKNMQWNTRGNRYSIPKPVAGTANGKMREKGGGQGGWGKDLILAEDQKEYVRALQNREREKRRDERDLLDQDYLPGLMGGNRSHASGGRIQIGAGRNVNAKKKRK